VSGSHIWLAVAGYLRSNWVEVAGFAATASGIWLTTKRRMICWPVVLAADLLYLVVFFHARLLSDAVLQVFFIGFTLYGWWHWWVGVREEGQVRVAPLPRMSLVAGMAAGALGAVAMGAVTSRLGAALPQLDATLASYSLVASWWQARKNIANWWMWIVVDILYIGEYLYKGLWATALLYLMLVVIACVGLLDWNRAMKVQQSI
jgi:nicotinamide mononucleotide transporter